MRIFSSFAAAPTSAYVKTSVPTLTRIVLLLLFAAVERNADNVKPCASVTLSVPPVTVTVHAVVSFVFAPVCTAVCVAVGTFQTVEAATLSLVSRFRAAVYLLKPIRLLPADPVE